MSIHKLVNISSINHKFDILFSSIFKRVFGSGRMLTIIGYPEMLTPQVSNKNCLQNTTKCFYKRNVFNCRTCSNNFRKR